MGDIFWRVRARWGKGLNDFKFCTSVGCGSNVIFFNVGVGVTVFEGWVWGPCFGCGYQGGGG